VSGAPFLSVVIPVYNEEKRLSSLTDVALFLRGQAFTTELIVVNDGSTDETSRLLARLDAQFGVRVLSYSVNRGKGFAIRTGILAATGAYRLFMDVDLSTPLKEIDHFLPLLGRYDIVIGSRKREGAQILVRQPSLRENLGFVFTLTSRWLLGLDVTDFTCGFKCFSASAAQTVFSRARIDRWGFDAEALFIAKGHGLTVHEVPVVWRNDEQTKVRFPRDLFGSAWELAALRVNHALGRYR
jgi:dolichyl-phosphate beta-glucosyltransferase